MEEKDFKDYLSALRRNIFICAIIASVIFAISALTALLLPPVYRSTATILIEEQEIPSDLVRSTITSFAAQRLQTISQRVMTRSNLLAIINKFNLYANERRKETTDEIVERMRQDISFQTVSADVIDPRSGHPTQATIAFTLSYDGESPELVQKIDNEITSLYLEENLRMRAKQTAEASDFLSNEVAQMGTYAMELEQKLSKFKEAHLRELPEQKQTTLQVIEHTENEIKDIELQLRGLQERNFLIDSQLVAISPETPIISSTGQHVMSAADRLKALRTQYISLASQYSEKHPDLLKARQEIRALEKEVGQVDPTLDQIKRLEQLRTDRASLSEKYTGGHPDIGNLDKQIAGLERSIAETDLSDKKSRVAGQFADNPAYLGLSAQKQSNLLEIAGLSKRKAELKAKVQDYEKRVQHSPDIERQYFALVRDWENTNNRYRELKSKQMEAQIAEQLERKSKGERFSVVEPPLLPEKPIKPNRLVIILVGFVMALVAAAGFIGLRVTLDNTVRKSSHIAELTGVPPLAVIPYLEIDDDVPTNKKRLALVLLITMACIVSALMLIHWFWLPMDVLWFRSLRKLDELFI